MKYCVKKNEDGTYKLAKKSGAKKEAASSSPLSELDKRIEKEKGKK